VSICGGIEAQAETIFVTSFAGGAIYRVQSLTGQKVQLPPGVASPADLVLDPQGILYVGGRFQGIKRFDTITNTFLPDVGTNVCGPEGPSIAPAGDLFVNTQSAPCAHSGVWRVPGRIASLATQAVPPFSSFGGATAFLRVGPFAGHLIAVDETGHRIVRAAPPSFGVPVDFIVLFPGDIPVGLAVSPIDGDVYVTLPVSTGPNAFTILRYGPDGVFKTVFGRIEAGHLEFDARGHLYVADTFNGRLARFAPNGTKSIVTDGIAGIFGVAVGPTFSDVPLTHFANPSVEAIFEAAVTAGCATTPPLYCPDAPVTREQMAAFIIRARGEFDPPQPATQRFLDVPPTNPFYRFIDRMAVLGITAGCGGTSYCPLDAVTRAQMAVFLARAFSL
jgi:hypothetical protein